jgi:hypothetical protein
LRHVAVDATPVERAFAADAQAPSRGAGSQRGHCEPRGRPILPFQQGPPRSPRFRAASERGWFISGYQETCLLRPSIEARTKASLVGGNDGSRPSTVLDRKVTHQTEVTHFGNVARLQEAPGLAAGDIRPDPARQCMASAVTPNVGWRRWHEIGPHCTIGGKFACRWCGARVGELCQLWRRRADGTAFNESSAEVRARLH